MYMVFVRMSRAFSKTMRFTGLIPKYFHSIAAARGCAKTRGPATIQKMPSDQPKNSENNEVFHDTNNLEARAAIKKIHSLVESLVSGSLEEESLQEHIDALQKISIDQQTLLDTPNIPKDAGIYKESLEKILARVPNGWGKWIDCGPGWFPIITELDEKLGALIPNYEIHQVKEKYGTLRFYWGVPETKLPCCVLFESNNQPPSRYNTSSGRAEKDLKTSELFNEWFTRYKEHLGSLEHSNRTRQLAEEFELNKDTWRKIGQRAQDLVDKAEELSSRTCEECGNLGSLREQSGWLRTLCVPCGDKFGYVLHESQEG
jgi:hypothetical protein